MTSLVQEVAPASFDTIEIAVLPSWKVGSLSGIVLLSEERAVCSKRLAVLLEHVSVEEVASVRAISASNSGTILDVLSLGKRGTKLRIVWTREELLLDASLWVRVGAGALCGLGTSGRGDGSGSVGLGISVGSSDENLEVSAGLASVGSGCAVNY
jgi:hypothetical protein